MSTLGNPFRRLRLGLGLLLASLAAVAALTTSAGAPVVAAQTVRETSRLPILLSDVNGAWTEGRSRWVSLSWTAQRDLEDVEFRMSSTAADVAISYPTETLDHAVLSNGSDLLANEIDTSLFFLATTTALPPQWELQVVVSWGPETDRSRAAATIWFTTIELNAGQPFVALTASAQVPSTGDGSQNWVELDFLGVSGIVGDFEVTLEGDLPVDYPQQQYASLHHDAILHADERDTARVWFDPQRIDPGTYEMIVTVEYNVPGDTRTHRQTHPLTVRVD